MRIRATQVFMFVYGITFGLVVEARIPGMTEVLDITTIQLIFIFVLVSLITEYAHYIFTSDSRENRQLVS